MQNRPFDADDHYTYAQALSDEGEAALRAGDAARARTILQEAVARWRALDDAPRLAQALHNLAVASATLQQFTPALPLLQEAIDLAKQTGSHADEAASRNALGNVYADLGQLSRAIELLRSAVPLRERTGEWRGLALTLGCLARVHDQMGDRLQALEYRRHAYEVTRTGNEPRAEAEALLELARASAAVGYLAVALEHFEHAAKLYATLGDTKRQGAALLAQAEARFEAGDREGAVAVAEQAFPLIRGTGAWTEMATQLERLGHTLRLTGQLQGLVHSWKRDRVPDVGGLRTAMSEHLAAEPDASPIHRLLEGLGGTLDHLANLPRPAPVAPEPTGDELAAADTRSVDELLAALQHRDQRERRVAALALGLRADQRAVEPLIGATRDRSQWVRLAAVRALGKLQDARGLDALAERLREDRDKEVRRSAATALRLLKDRRAVDVLTEALTDESWRVVEAAEKALRALKTASRLDVLIDLLRVGNVERRSRAAIRLGDLGDQRAVAPLLEVAARAQEGDQLRLHALGAAAKLDAARAAGVALRILEAPRDGRAIAREEAGAQVALICKAAGVAGQAGNVRAVPALVAVLDDGNPYVRYAAIRALGSVGAPEAIPALEGIQQRDHATIQVDPSAMRHVRLRNVAAEAILTIRTRQT